MTSDASDQPSDNSSPLGFQTHDHRACVDKALSVVERACADRGLRLTPVRRKVLELLLKEHRAVGAYAILDHLRDAGFSAQPPVAYRALDFLIANGFAHKIERLSAYVACAHPGEAHSPAFMICRGCDGVVEAPAMPESSDLVDAARRAGFVIERTVVEAEGVCPRCSEAEPE